MAAVKQTDTEWLWRCAFTGRPAAVGWRVCLPEALPPFSQLALWWMVCPHSRGLVPLVSQFVSQLVSLLVSQLGSPSCFPLLDGVSAFPWSSLPCLPVNLPACLPACLHREMRILSQNSGIENDVIFHLLPPMFSTHPF
jgi:hypothetical protein